MDIAGVRAEGVVGLTAVLAQVGVPRVRDHHHTQAAQQSVNLALSYWATHLSRSTAGRRAPVSSLCQAREAGGLAGAEQTSSRVSSPPCERYSRSTATRGGSVDRNDKTAFIFPSDLGKTFVIKVFVCSIAPLHYLQRTLTSLCLVCCPLLHWYSPPSSRPTRSMITWPPATIACPFGISPPCTAHSRSWEWQPHSQSHATPQS